MGHFGKTKWQKTLRKEQNGLSEGKEKGVSFLSDEFWFLSRIAKILGTNISNQWIITNPCLRTIFAMIMMK